MKKALFFLILLSLTVFALPEPTGWVNDYADIIEPELEAKITSLIDNIEANTTAEISVVTVKKLEDKSLEETALQYLEEWGVGKKETDNGVVILVALQERKYRIETGYGVEGILPDARVGRIGRETLKLYFKQGKYGEGIYAAVKEIGGLLKQDPSIVAKYSPRRDMIQPFAGLIFFIAFFLVFINCGRAAAKETKKKKWRSFFIRNGTLSGSLIALGIWIPYSAFIMDSIFIFIIGLIIFRRITALPMRRGFHGPIWWGGSRGFGGIGRGSGGFGGLGGFGGGLGGGGGASGGW